MLLLLLHHPPPPLREPALRRPHRPRLSSQTGRAKSSKESKKPRSPSRGSATPSLPTARPTTRISRRARTPSCFLTRRSMFVLEKGPWPPDDFDNSCQRMACHHCRLFSPFPSPTTPLLLFLIYTRTLSPSLSPLIPFMDCTPYQTGA